MRKMKKLTSLLLVLVMSLALAIPCFAAEPEQKVIRLEIGESYTEPETGITYSLKPWAGYSDAEQAAIMSGRSLPTPRAGGRHYFSRGVDLNTTKDYTASYTAVGSFGNTFAADIDTSPTKLNAPSGDWCVTVALHSLDTGYGCEGIIPIGEKATFEVTYPHGGISGTVTMSLSRSPKLWVWYDVYQYES